MSQNSDFKTPKKDVNLDQDQTNQAYDKNRSQNLQQQNIASGAKEQQSQDDKFNRNVATDLNMDVKSNLLSAQDIKNKDLVINKDKESNQDINRDVNREIKRDINLDVNRNLNPDWDKDKNKNQNQGYNANDLNKNKI